ncbi:MAG: patatin-like phospholipase, partial [Faunusvirus sp.]
KHIIFSTSCISDYTVKYIDHTTYPDMSVLNGLRMSISLPIIFEPVVYNDELFYDGGLLDNYPIQLATNDQSTIGIVITDLNLNEKRAATMAKHVINVFNCIILSTVIKKITEYENITIRIDLTKSPVNVDIMELGISNSTKTDMYTYGYNVAEKYYDTQDIKLLVNGIISKILNIYE